MILSAPAGVGGAAAIAAVVAVIVATAVLAVHGIGASRTTSDFYVASRTVTPWRNAAAVSGEYLSAASFLGVGGLVYSFGLDMLWFPVGYTMGYLVLLVLVAAPLRRSGAYTLPDFAEARMESRAVRRACSVFVVLIGWFYLLPLLQGAGLALHTLAGTPTWVGTLVVDLVVTGSVFGGGMRGVTLSQGIQYWVKLAAIAVPAVVLVLLWQGAGAPAPQLPGGDSNLLGTEVATDGQRLYATLSTLMGLCLGTMGLPHVLVRFYTNPDGPAARRTTLAVLGLVGAFYLFPPVIAVIGRALVPQLPPDVSTDAILLVLPRLVDGGWVGQMLTAVVAAGATAAFVSTASGLTVAVSGVIDQDLIRPRLHRWTGGDVDGIQTFRLSTLIATSVPIVLVLASGRLGLATTVGLAFAVAASTFGPLLVLGVWWRRLSVPGALAGLLVGGLGSLADVVLVVAGVRPDGWGQAILLQPAAVTVPAAFAVTVLVSLATADRVPRGTLRTMVRLHSPVASTMPGPRG